MNEILLLSVIIGLGSCMMMTGALIFAEEFGWIRIERWFKMIETTVVFIVGMVCGIGLTSVAFTIIMECGTKYKSKVSEWTKKN